MTNYEKLTQTFPNIPDHSGLDIWGDFWDEKYQEPKEGNNEGVNKEVGEEGLTEFIITCESELQKDESYKIKRYRELVRCKDCKFQVDMGRRYPECDKHFLLAKDNWFCADGERK